MKWGLNRPNRGWCQTSKFGCWPKKMLLSYKFGEGAILCYRWFSRDSPLLVVLVHVYLLLIFQNDVAQWNVGILMIRCSHIFVFPILNSFTVYLILSHQFPRMIMVGDKSLVETCYLSIFHHSDIPIFHSATDEDIIRGGTQFSIPTLHGGPTGNAKIPQLRDVQNETGVCPIFLWSRHYSYV